MFPLANNQNFDAKILYSGGDRVLRQSSASDKKRCCFCCGSSLEQESGERQLNVIREALLPALVSITDTTSGNTKEK
jgi:hypothetical protein